MLRAQDNRFTTPRACLGVKDRTYHWIIMERQTYITSPTFCSPVPNLVCPCENPNAGVYLVCYPSVETTWGVFKSYMHTVHGHNQCVTAKSAYGCCAEVRAHCSVTLDDNVTEALLKRWHTLIHTSFSLTHRGSSLLLSAGHVQPVTLRSSMVTGRRALRTPYDPCPVNYTS